MQPTDHSRHPKIEKRRIIKTMARPGSPAVQPEDQPLLELTFAQASKMYARAVEPTSP